MGSRKVPVESLARTDYVGTLFRLVREGVGLTQEEVARLALPVDTDKPMFAANVSKLEREEGTWKDRGRGHWATVNNGSFISVAKVLELPWADVQMISMGRMPDGGELTANKLIQYANGIVSSKSKTVQAKLLQRSMEEVGIGLKPNATVEDILAAMRKHGGAAAEYADKQEQTIRAMAPILLKEK